VGGASGPSGSSGCRSVGLGFDFGFALLEPEALAIHLEDMDVVCQAVEERAGEAFRTEDLGPFIEGQVRALSDQNSGSFFDHPVIAANCQNFGLFMGTRESQLQPNLR
jgi:hypothetical protein